MDSTRERDLGDVEEMEDNQNPINELNPMIVIPATICDSMGFQIAEGVLTSVEMAMIVIGTIYLHDCPVEPYIPIFLVVEGVIGILTCLLDLWTNLTSYCTGKDTEKSKPVKVVSRLLLLAMFAWFIAGCVWVYPVYQPNFNDTADPNYCHKTVYWCSFWEETLTCIGLGALILVVCVLGIEVLIMKKANITDFKALVILILSFILTVAVVLIVATVVLVIYI